MSVRVMQNMSHLIVRIVRVRQEHCTLALQPVGCPGSEGAEEDTVLQEWAR